MKKMIDTVKAFFEKRPLLSNTLKTTLITFVVTGAVMAVLYLVLWATKVYPKLQTALDLKYNAPAIFVPMCIFAALSAVCWVVGALMYFHKYKRSKTKTAFYKALAPVFGKK